MQNLDSILKALSSDTLNLEEKIALLEKNKSLFFSEKKVEPLIDLLKHLIQEHVKEIRLYHLLSNVYRRNKQYREAEHIFLQSLPIAKEIKPYFYNYLAHISLENNELDKAEQYVNQALKANPNNPRFYRVHAMILSKKCHYLKALKEVEKALKITTEQKLMIELELQKVEILEKTEQKYEAKRILNDLNNRYPEDESIERRLQRFHQLNHTEKMNHTLKQNHFIVSMVVDALPLHYYQAELLLYSLEQCAQVQKEHILVQCLSRVDKVFLDFLDTEGYEYRIIEPYLDGKYCNKLQQLEAFQADDLEGIDGVILLDTDMFALQPFDIPDCHRFSAKIVDGPNPSLAVLRNIFKEANIQIPTIVPSDRIVADNQTFACNFNGGFYYVPSGIVSELSFEWRKWASWLYNRSDLFIPKRKAIHTDQVSIAMAVTSLELPYYNLPANINMPIQNNKVLTSFREDQEIMLLHYHREVTPFGVLNNKKVNNQKIIAAIERANSVIVKKEKYHFFLQYKKSLVPNISIEESLNDINQELKEMTALHSQKLRLIIHVGTPKTATTSLQFFLDHQHDLLLEKGILYPKVYIGTFAPKHQWMVSALMTENYRMFLDKLKQGLNETRHDTHTVILSTEGIYNHWHDYSVKSKAFLVLLSRYFKMEIWVWFREPASLAKSLYHQYMKNQRLPSVKCYGHNMTFDEMLEDEWFVKHLDYTGFLLECGEMFGEENLSSFILDGDIIKMVSHKLGLHIDSKSVERKNISLTCVSVEILKIINNYPLTGVQKNKAVEYLYEIDALLKSYTHEDESCNTSAESINRLFALQHSILKKKYFLDFRA